MGAGKSMGGTESPSSRTEKMWFASKPSRMRKSQSKSSSAGYSIVDVDSTPRPARSKGLEKLHAMSEVMRSFVPASFTSHSTPPRARNERGRPRKSGGLLLEAGTRYGNIGSTRYDDVRSTRYEDIPENNENLPVLVDSYGFGTADRKSVV